MKELCDNPTHANACPRCNPTRSQELLDKLEFLKSLLTETLWVLREAIDVIEKPDTFSRPEIDDLLERAKELL